MSPRQGLDFKKVIQTGGNLANREGFYAVTIASLAKELNVRPPSLYNHIKGLEELRKELALSGLQQLYHLLKSTVEHASAEDAVYHLSKAYVSFVRKSPGIYEATATVAPRIKDEEVQKASDNILFLVLDVLKPYQLPENEALHAVRSLRSILHGFSSLEHKGGFGMSLSTDETLDFLIRTFALGLHRYKQTT
ncbi:MULTISPECIES: TetR/AcrR family transcriptional regulator [Priestia]|jgi:AcrR family transcriptional regulator|uniref:TetR/AcrR family transcriptional regulator n=1 Tax=Priestia TaxID=2800373 RepID=UPI00094C1D6B|nr:MULTISPECIES: TetR/AcrR family transcriptional regulator [Priestia]MBY0094130.1 WHG domain-containing protein [Priestia aryabhattai]MBY0101771.1 WHG domain-containing protein [Priestia aryabhattai]MCM3094716.1 TetR/AcrR family transcriptional regulator [Priestia megaterium]MCM3307310.1 TetR/AcrR family transcriptional regulator [Priestia megaterium]MED4024749.1 WHG domain-containing protein [Priestia megaterium]